jgi:hypothetical protein
VSHVAAATATNPAQAAPQAASSGLPLWSHGSFSFKDLLDIVNPLQHLPVIGSVYRYLSGDEPSGGARIIGDTLYGGPIGFGVSVVSTAMLTDSNDHDVGERMLADVFGPRDGSAPAATAVAAAQPAATSAQPLQMAALGAGAGPSASETGLIQPSGSAQPVAMNQLFRSPPPATPPAATTPAQTFLAQTAQFQRQISTGRGTNGAVLSGRPVPLELSSNLLPMLPPGARLVAPGTATAAAVTGAPATPVAAANSPAQAAPLPAPSATDPNPLAQKMLDALDKYEQLKKQQEQDDSADQGASPKVDLSL